MNRDELLAQATDVQWLYPEEWAERLAATTDKGVQDLINGAEEWAKMMDVCILKHGMSVFEAADATYGLSWLYGTSGHAAVQATLLLVRHWQHGEALQSWHNRRNGVPAEQDHRGLVDRTVIET